MHEIIYSYSVQLTWKILYIFFKYINYIFHYTLNVELRNESKRMKKTRTRYDRQ